MRSPVRQKVRTFSTAALLVAFLHQTGACSCGCIEHNLWVQSARLVLGMEPLGDHPEVVNGEHAALAAGDDHCDEDSPTAYVRARTQFGPHSASAGPIASITTEPLLVGNATSRLTTSRCFPSGSLLFSARAAARAQLQVYLI